MKGILFKPEMHLAIRELRKTQTRRLIIPQPERPLIQNAAGNWRYSDNEGIATDSPTWKSRYHVGEVVYIKEAWQITDVDPPEGERLPTRTTYKDGASVWAYRPPTMPRVKCDKWFTPLFMPSWAARDFIQITDVRPERLQDINEEDAIAEGIANLGTFGRGREKTTYANLWDSINKKMPWSMNPWVWRISFNSSTFPANRSLYE